MSRNSESQLKYNSISKTLILLYLTIILTLSNCGVLEINLTRMEKNIFDDNLYKSNESQDKKSDSF